MRTMTPLWMIILSMVLGFIIGEITLPHPERHIGGQFVLENIRDLITAPGDNP